MYSLFIEFLARSAPDTTGVPSIELWSADADPAASEAIARRNDAICGRLRESLPSLSSAKAQEDYTELCADDALSQEQVLRRFHRMRALAGRWRDGDLRFEIFDDVAYLEVPVSADDSRNRTEYTDALEALIALVIETSGMTPRLPDGASGTSARAAAVSAMTAADTALSRMARQYRILRLQQQLAMPSLAVFALLAIVATLALLWTGLDRGTLMAAADGNAPATFVTEATLPPTYQLGVFPKFALRGRVAETQERVELPVFREQYLRAGAGAPFTVLHTGNAGTPYVLRSDYDNAAPVVRIGSIGIAWHTWLAIAPPALFYVWIVRPLRRGPESQRARRLADVTAKLKYVLLIAGFALAAVLARRIL